MERYLIYGGERIAAALGRQKGATPTGGVGCLAVCWVTFAEDPLEDGVLDAEAGHFQFQNHRSSPQMAPTMLPTAGCFGAPAATFAPTTGPMGGIGGF